MMARTTRLITLDILRGFFLFVIIVDHVELFPSFFDLFSGRGRLWVSAAEGFFFISGLLAGYIYRKKLAKGFRFVWKKLWQRAGLLYVVSVILTLLFTYVAVTAGDSAIKHGLPAVVHWPEVIANTLLLRYSFGWADFLPHYVIFMLWAPLAIFLLAKRKWWLLAAASLGLWLVRGQDFTLAWQLLFIGGMIIGYHWEALKHWFTSLRPLVQTAIQESVIIVALITFAFSYASVYVLSELNAAKGDLPAMLIGLASAWDALNTTLWPYFEKWTLEPGRVILFGLWFFTGYILLERYARQVPLFIRQSLLLLGKNSLFVYGLHSIVIFILHLVVNQGASIVFNAFITALVLGIVLGVTWLKAQHFKVRQIPKFLKLSPQPEKE